MNKKSLSLVLVLLTIAPLQAMHRARSCVRQVAARVRTFAPCIATRTATFTRLAQMFKTKPVATTIRNASIFTRRMASNPIARYTTFAALGLGAAVTYKAKAEGKTETKSEKATGVTIIIPKWHETESLQEIISKTDKDALFYTQPWCAFWLALNTDSKKLVAEYIFFERKLNILQQLQKTLTDTTRKYVHFKDEDVQSLKALGVNLDQEQAVYRYRDFNTARNWGLIQIPTPIEPLEYKPAQDKKPDSYTFPSGLETFPNAQNWAITMLFQGPLGNCHSNLLFGEPWPISRPHAETIIVHPDNHSLLNAYDLSSFVVSENYYSKEYIVSLINQQLRTIQEKQAYKQYTIDAIMPEKIQKELTLIPHVIDEKVIKTWHY